MSNQDQNYTAELLSEAEAGWKVGLSYLPTQNQKTGKVRPPNEWNKLCDNPPTQEQQSQFRQELLKSGSALALACGRVTNGNRLICIDVDNDKLVPLMEAVLGKTICGRFGSKGIGIFVLVDAKDDSFKKWKEVKFKNGEAGIEILTRDRITIVPPSKHRKTGKPYKWISGELVSSLDNLPILTKKQWDLINVVVSSPEALILLGGSGTHDAMVSLCAKLVRFSDDDDFLTAVIKSLFPSSYDGDNNSDKEISRTLKSAREKGFDKFRKSSGTSLSEETTERLDKFNKQFCVVNQEGKTFILEKAYNPELDRYGYIYWQVRDFKNFYVDELVEIASRNDTPAYQSIGDVWFKWSQRSKASGIYLLPNHEPGLIMLGGKTVYNLWNGFGVEPKPGSWAQLEYHLREVLCAGNEEHFAYLVGWLANAVQTPGRQGEVAIVLRGGRGTGKGTLGRMLARIFAQHYFHTASQSQVAGRFNVHLRDTVLLFADEAFFAGDKRHEGVLKSLITEDFLSIEAKFVNVVQTRNRLSIIMATNDEWAVPAGSDERRYFVLDVSDAHKQDNDVYFKELNEAISGEELPAMLNALLEYDLGDFNLRNVPQTKALNDQKLHSLDSVSDWLFVKLQDGRLLDTQEWDAPVATKELYRDYVEYTKMKNGWPKADNAFSKKLRTILEPETVRNSDAAGYRARALAFPSLVECRKRFDAHVGFETNWPEEDTKKDEPRF